MAGPCRGRLQTSKQTRIHTKHKLSVLEATNECRKKTNKQKTTTTTTTTYIEEIEHKRCIRVAIETFLTPCIPYEFP